MVDAITFRHRELPEVRARKLNALEARVTVVEAGGSSTFTVDGGDSTTDFAADLYLMVDFGGAT